MKNIYRFLAALLPFLAASCVGPLEEEMTPADKNETVTITLHSNITKTMLVDDQYVVWEDGDQVVINGSVYDISLDADNPGTAYVENVQAADTYTAYYYHGIDDWDNGRILIAILDSQQYRQGSFAQFVNSSVAFSSTTDLHFYNMASVLKLGIKGDSVNLKSVSVAGNNDEAMGGYYAISFDQLENLQNLQDLPHAGEGYFKTSSIELSLGQDGIQLSETPQYVYMVIPAQTYSKGITVTLSDSEGRVCVKSTAKSITAARSEIVDMAEFTFSEAESFSVSDVTAGITSVSYTVKAQANSSIRTLLMYKNTWDKYASTSFADRLDQLPSAVLDSYGITVQVGADGVYQANETRAWNYYGNFSYLHADTEYKLITAYADGDAARGKITVTDVKTLPASGTAPELQVNILNVSWNLAHFNVFTSDNAANFSYFLFSAAEYEEYTSQGYTDIELSKMFNVNASDSWLEAAKHTDGCYINYDSLQSSTGWVFLVQAANETGMSVVKKCELATGSYVDPNASWITVTSEARLACGFLSPYSIDTFDINGLTVDKMAGEDFFRIRDLSKALNASLGEQLFDEPAETEYFYIDARDNGRVVVEYMANPMYVSGSRVCFYTAASRHEGFNFGTFDKNIPMISLGQFIYQYVDGSLYVTNESWLVFPAGTSFEPSGMTIESFTKSPDVVEW